MKIGPILTSTAIALCALVTAPGFSHDKGEEAREKTIQLSEVPQAAMAAAEKALGTAPTKAKEIGGTSPQRYELEAKNASGKEIGVDVSADGKVLKKPHDEAAEHEEHQKQ